MAALQLLGRGAPQSVARGAPRIGDRAAAAMPRLRLWIPGHSHAVAGSHLPAEDTAPPWAVAPFRVVAPCPAPQKLHAPPRPITGFRFKKGTDRWRMRKHNRVLSFPM